MCELTYFNYKTKSAFTTNVDINYFSCLLLLIFYFCGNILNELQTKVIIE